MDADSYSCRVRHANEKDSNSFSVWARDCECDDPFYDYYDKGRFKKGPVSTDLTGQSLSSFGRVPIKH